MKTLRDRLIALACAALVLTGPAAAETVDLGQLVTASLKAMNESRWEDALADLNTATAPFAQGNADDYGPQFGVLYYRRGICELKLKRWHEAMKSFETCYRRFPHAGGKFTGGNVFGKRALLKWGEAALGAEDWALALRQFDRFLAEIDTTMDPFPQGPFYINRCIAHFKLGNIPEGIGDLEIAIANKENFPTPDANIVAGFQAFVGAAIENNKSLEADRRGVTSPDLTKLAAACLHEASGNPRGAYAAYEQLELYYPEAETREDNLCNLVRTASIISEVFATEKYGRLFLKTYPNSKNVPQVRRTLLSSLFYEGEYATCIEVASTMIDQLARGTLEHDLCLHVLGGSYYYCGEFQKAQPVLDRHVELYPESQLAEAARYYQASNLSRLSEDKSPREQAIYEKVKALIAKQDWFMAETTAKFYLDRERNAFTKHLAEVTTMLARSYEERDSINDAIALYQDAFARAPGRVGASVPALKRWMELMWRRNLPAKEDAQGRQLPGDRQAAYEGGARFIAATSRAEFQNKLTPEEKALWRELAELVQQYEANPTWKHPSTR